MLFKEIIAVYSENHVKPINTKCSITDCQSRWLIYFPYSLKGLIQNLKKIKLNMKRDVQERRDKLKAKQRKLGQVRQSH
jgi:hypothetical protein